MNQATERCDFEVGSIKGGWRQCKKLAKHRVAKHASGGGSVTLLCACDRHVGRMSLPNRVLYRQIDVTPIVAGSK